ncbi:unnamed protein product, partial [Mesorhabditis spiculigera]
MSRKNISDAVRRGSTPEAHFDSLVKAFYLPVAVLGLAAVLFFLSILTTGRDLRSVERELEVTNEGGAFDGSMTGEKNRVFDD